jgi:hypothetical protein
VILGPLKIQSPLHPAKCTMLSAVCKQGIIRLIFMEGTIKKQQYLQQLQNDIIPAI